MQGIKQRGCALLTCCLSMVAGVSRSELLPRSCGQRARGEGCTGGTPEEMPGCVWAKDLELENASNFLLLPAASHGWWHSG